MNIRSLAVGGTVFMVMLAGPASVRGVVVINQITNINNGGGGFGNVNVFGNPPVAVTDTAVSNGNDIVVYTLIAGANNGAGLSVAISNGENGIDSTNGGANIDIPNATPANPVFAALGNASGKLENGNAIRLSMWMRQDPASPMTKQPNVEPVLKVELWKEALSGSADFNNVAFPGCCDRIWDTDQNAGNAAFVGFNQSQASWVDVNNSGVIANGRPVTASLVTNEWRRVETSLVVDDDPLNDGFGWSIGPDFFDVADVEEIRAVMFVGDFGSGMDLSGGGSFWVDNLMVEVFKDQATMLATPNPNTIPVDGIPGDYNNNGTVDAADYAVWRDGPALPAAYDTWKMNFGRPPGAGAGLGGTANVPEPVSCGLMILAMGGFGMLRAIGKGQTTGTNR
jgi:hypothetical protein